MPSRNAKLAQRTRAPTVVVSPLFSPIPVAAARLGLSRATIYQLIKRGELAVAKFGTRTLIAESELVRLAEAIEAGRFAIGKK